MKKTNISYKNTDDLYIGDVLYVGIDAVGGGWICTTDGDPFAEDSWIDGCNDNGCPEAATRGIEIITSVISDPSTIWEPLTEDDEEYISETLESWGIR